MTANKEAASTDFVGIDVASKTIGVSPSTLRNWEAKGKISSRRQPGGHRVYAVQDVLELAAKNGNPGKIIGSNEEEREIALDMVHNTYSLADASVLLDVSLETLRRCGTAASSRPVIDGCSDRSGTRRPRSTRWWPRPRASRT